MKYYKKLIGKNIYLSPFSDEDYILFTEWINDYETARDLNQFSNVFSLEDEKDFVENTKKSNKIYLSIVKEENDELIGNISLANIDNIHKTATLGIMIGKKDERGKGYGTEAITLMLDYAFNYLNLNNIMLEALCTNIKAVKCYEKCGFKKMGIRRESSYINGKYRDNIFMQILKKDFLKKQRKSNSKK
jgi:RimJ/RimL family protein N-acetyltransferase